MKIKPSIRYGLPYRWWRSRGFLDAIPVAISILMLILMAVSLLAIVMGLAADQGTWT